MRPTAAAGAAPKNSGEPIPGILGIRPDGRPLFTGSGTAQRKDQCAKVKKLGRMMAERCLPVRTGACRQRGNEATRQHRNHVRVYQVQHARNGARAVSQVSQGIRTLSLSLI
jgi:hypothetical protein